MSRLSDLYNKQIRNEMQEKFGYTNVMDIQKLEKIVINIGVGEATENTKTVDAAASDLEAITGQKPMICKAHKSLAAWKIREGMPLGCKVTLRGERMYEFIDFEKIDRVRGMDIIVVTTAKTDEEARELLTKFGMPFKK